VIAQDVLDRTPRELKPWVLREGVQLEELSPLERERVASVSHRVFYKGLHGGGALRLFEEVYSPSEVARGFVPTDADRRNAFGFLPTGTFVTSRGLTHLENTDFLRDNTEFLQFLNRRNPNANVLRTGQWIETAIMSGMAVRAPLPTDAIDASSKRGLVVHLAALAGNPFEPPVVQRLERDGWVVVSLDTISGVPTPRNNTARAQRSKDRAELRTIEDRLRDAASPLGNKPENTETRELLRRRTELLASLREMEKSDSLRSFEICDGGDAAAVGIEIAREIDESLASNAYCAQALVEYAHAQFPSLVSKPIVIVGFSAGALAAPTAAVRLREQGFDVSAMVLIGGGADLFDVAQKSTLTDGGIRLRCTKDGGTPKPPSKETAEAVHEAYLRTSQLDPSRLAPTLTHVPTLMLHADWDEWVPASTGERLYDLLGKPDRWRLRLGGHGMLFYLLPTKAGDIASWVRAATSTDMKK
jgi:predicted esterase